MLQPCAGEILKARAAYLLLVSISSVAARTNHPPLCQPLVCSQACRPGWQRSASLPSSHPLLPTPTRRGPSASCTPTLCCRAPSSRWPRWFRTRGPGSPFLPLCLPRYWTLRTACQGRWQGCGARQVQPCYPDQVVGIGSRPPTPLSTAGRVAHQGHGCRCLNRCRCLGCWECGWMGRQQLQH
jgi:hypothetical protein